MIKIECLKCVHCTGEYCEVYGDDAVYATSKCAEDLFKNYIVKGKSESTIMKEVDYTIYSKPDYITFECPHCESCVQTDFDNIDFHTGYWGDGGYVDCPVCDQEVLLGDYEYN
jgi:hypothetical protein